MQHGQKRCVRVVGERLAQSQRAVRTQLGHEPIRQAPGGILIRLGRRIRLARATRRPANREHGPLHGPVRSGSFSIRARFLRRGRREILGAHEAALDLRRPGRVKADEGAATGDHLRVEPNRPVLEPRQRLLDLAQARVNGVRQLIGALVLRLKLIVLPPQRVVGGLIRRAQGLGRRSDPA